MKTYVKNKKAFTLIELLIVIAIIGILFIVLVSRVDFATDKAKASGVQTDFRSFQTALEQVARENSGFATLGWDTGDDNGDRIRNSYDKGDKACGQAGCTACKQDGVKGPHEVWVGSKTYGENWEGVYTLVNPANNKDTSAFVALETAINANLDPKLHITITPNTDASGNLTGSGEITMANQAKDPWKNQYAGSYITNATVDKLDRGSIIIYSTGANGKLGVNYSVSGGLVGVEVHGNNVNGKDDYVLSVTYSYSNGYGEVQTGTAGFSNNQSNLTSHPIVDNGVNAGGMSAGAGSVPGGGNGGEQPGNNPDTPNTNEVGIALNKVYAGNGYYLVFTDSDSVAIFMDIPEENVYKIPISLFVLMNNPTAQLSLTYQVTDDGYIDVCMTNETNAETTAVRFLFDKAANTLTATDDTMVLSMSNEVYSSYYVNTTYYSYIPAIPDVKVNNDGKMTDLDGNILDAFTTSEVRDHVLYDSGEAFGYLSMDGTALYIYGDNSFIKVLSIESPGNSNPYEHYEPGLYQSGSNYTIKLKSWEQLLAEGAITVDSATGMLYTYIHPANTSWSIGTNPSSELLVGDLLLPQDGSVKRLGNGVGFGPDISEDAYAAFWGCDGLTGVVLPQNMTYIDAFAFMSCNGLTTIAPVGYGADVELQYNIEGIGPMAFFGCFGLQVIMLPSSVTTLEDSAFVYCGYVTGFVMSPNIQHIGVGALAGLGSLSSYTVEFNFCGNSKYDYIDGCLIDKTTKTLVWGNSDAVIPNDGSVLIIGASAFEEMPITSIVIPKSVQKIDAQAFRYATKLSSIRYEGTMEDWNSIDKHENWFYQLGTGWVHCLDGEISLK